MTIDEAKAALKILRGSKSQADFMDEALDIALWLLDREQSIRPFVFHEDGEGAMRTLLKYEREHPRPGS